ncbi:MAG: permease-like cell division protein FtsX [Prevotella sp.]|nr:permease-like cell division protein FtsX [Prevotella sp.]MCH3984887.1 permease-like cell division protein FtsX [Prevotella sp.]MCH3991450.1 permease-like cell division protein FtsX [Prevotella sp.]MCH4018631.1 permease-like cell division protein FtsX [Prevotella sp.]MCH4100267.1 permease-like cell division protein FtsX [Prevotella sp.]
MGKNRQRTRNHHGLQVVTLCISTAMVLVLLGLVVCSTLLARNLSTYVKENFVVQIMLDQDMTSPEAQQICNKLKVRPYVNSLHYVSKEEALREGTKELGTNPSEFAGVNPFLSSIEITVKGNYANDDSLRWISRELKTYPKVSEIDYQKDLINEVNQNIAKISVILLVIAVLLTFVSFSLISNTVRLGIYSRRFSIHTMKLVGASWGFIRRPFITDAILIGLVAAVLSCAVLGCGVYALYRYEPGILTIMTWREMAITGAAVFLFGIIITAICASISVNKFLKMKAGELYKI